MTQQGSAASDDIFYDCLETVDENGKNVSLDSQRRTETRDQSSEVTDTIKNAKENHANFVPVEEMATNKELTPDSGKENCLKESPHQTEARDSGETVSQCKGLPADENKLQNAEQTHCAEVSHENEEQHFVSEEEKSCESSDHPLRKPHQNVGEEVLADEDKESSSESEDELSEADIEERKIAAEKLKQDGNEMFKSQEVEKAKDIYTEGLRICPKCLNKEKAILYSNRSACLMKLGQKEEAIEDCTKAVMLHPTYLKALLRRAQLHEETEKLDEALKDYEAVLEMDPSVHVARAACMRLPDKIKERNEKLKAEMMSKLKDLGNLVLRPFGLSTDNFNLQQDPSTGSYNVQFNNSPNNQQ